MSRSPTTLQRTLLGLAAPLFVLAGAPRPAAAQPRAAYVDASELAPDPLPHLAETALFARYQRSLGDSPVDVSVFEGAASNRFLIGRTATYCLGLDGYAGGGKPGASYGATAFLAGFGVRSRRQDFIAACGGVGLDALGESLPLGFKIAPEVRAAVSLGPLRPQLWFQPSWQLQDDRQRADDDFPFDDFEAGIWLRFGAQHRYWRQLSAGGGPAIGFSYADRAGVRQLGFWLGLDFAGGV